MRTVFIFLITFTTVFSFAEKKYKIKFDRPGIKGDYIAEHFLTISNEMKIENEGTVLRNRSQYVAAEIFVKVHKNYEEDKFLNFLLTVKKFTMKKALDGDFQEVYTPGTKIMVSKQGEGTKYSVDGEVIKDLQVIKALREVYKMDKKGKGDMNDDLAFGTAELQGVGDKWGVNKENIVKELAEKKINIDKKDLSGEFTIDDVSDHNGEECLSISGFFKTAKMQIKAPNGKLKNSNLIGTFKLLFPADLKKSRIKESMKMEVDISFILNSGETMNSTLKRSLNSIYKKTPRFQ